MDRKDIDRFWDKVAPFSSFEECWVWIAGKHTAGYGRIRLSNRVLYAHRVSYELVLGEIPAGLQLDHLCRNRVCVNPAHLEAVPQRVNLLRGESFSAQNYVKTRCISGHIFDSDNTYTSPDGRRHCRTCQRVRVRKWRRDTTAGKFCQVGT